MTRLLVSVRNADEARLALAAGVDLIDVKAPEGGSLGFAGWRAIGDVLEAVGERAPVSAALGELAEFDLSGLSEMPDGLAYVKAGLSGEASRWDWRARLGRLRDRLPTAAKLVAVAYADRTAKAPAAPEVLAAAEELGCAAALVDTFDKSRGPLTAHWSPGEIADWIGGARSAGMLSVVAGSLAIDGIGDLLPLGPDYVAVRGAVCQAGRTSAIDAMKLERLVATLGRRIDLSRSPA